MLFKDRLIEHHHLKKVPRLKRGCDDFHLQPICNFVQFVELDLNELFAPGFCAVEREFVVTPSAEKHNVVIRADLEVFFQFSDGQR